MSSVGTSYVRGHNSQQFNSHPTPHYAVHPRNQGNTQAAVEMSALLTEIGVQAFCKGALFEAADMLSKAITRNPRSSHLHAALAVVNEQLGRVETALGNAQRAVALDPSNEHALASLSRLSAAVAAAGSPPPTKTKTLSPPHRKTVITRLSGGERVGKGSRVPLPPIRSQEISKQATSQ